MRLAELCEKTLDSADGAIDAHKKRLEIDPAEVDALRALERLYERTEHWRELVETLRAHAEISSDDQERRVLVAARGRACATNASKIWTPQSPATTRLITDLGPDRDTLRALALLYERSERHADLLETLHERGIAVVTTRPSAPSCSSAWRS